MLYKTRDTGIVHEQIDAEVIVINMDSGNYYSLMDTGVDIWNALCEGIDKQSLCSRLANSYTDHENKIQGAVEDLVSNLLKEELIEATESESTNSTPSGSTSANKQPFLAPKYEIYSDVQDLLLLDPIHDVTDGGWPIAENKLE